jgi:uncharacterized membrane protein YhhN
MFFQSKKKILIFCPDTYDRSALHANTRTVNFRTLSTLYFATGIVFIALETISWTVPGIIAKALIIPILLLIYRSHTRQSAESFHRLILAALVCSWAGDVLLQFASYNETFFLAGLGSFLIAQLMYVLAFFSTPGKNRVLFGPGIWLIIPVLAYGTGLLYYLWDGLGDMRIPVMVYAIVILTMLSAALNREGKVNRLSYLLVLLGAILFVLSDSLIAVNKFKASFALARIAIMTTYITAQYLIITGCLKQFSVSLK